jgi:hypothetical protein
VSLEAIKAIAQEFPEVEPLTLKLKKSDGTVVEQHIHIRHMGVDEAMDVADAGSKMKGANGEFDAQKLKQYRVDMLHRSIVNESGQPDVPVEELRKLRSSVFDQIEAQVLEAMKATASAAGQAKGN